MQLVVGASFRSSPAAQRRAAATQGSLSDGGAAAAAAAAGAGKARGHHHPRLRKSAGRQAAAALLSPAARWMAAPPCDGQASRQAGRYGCRRRPLLVSPPGRPAVPPRREGGALSAWPASACSSLARSLARSPRGRPVSAGRAKQAGRRVGRALLPRPSVRPSSARRLLACGRRRKAGRQGKARATLELATSSSPPEPANGPTCLRLLPLLACPAAEEESAGQRC